MAEQRSVEYIGQRDFKKHKENWLRQGWTVVIIAESKLHVGMAPIADGLAVSPKPHHRLHVTYERPS